MSTLAESYRIMVVIPAFNEQASLCQVVQKALSLGYEVVVVDDGSAIPLKATLQELPVHYLRHAINLGQGAALQTGIEYALQRDADLVVTLDADGQHAPSDIALLSEPVLAGEADICLGSRFLKGSIHNMRSRRKTLLQLARFINFLFTGLLLTDAHNGLRAMNRKAASTIKLRENRMAHATEILAQIRIQQLRWKEVPVSVAYTSYSQQKGQSGWNSFRILFDLLLGKLYR